MQNGLLQFYYETEKQLGYDCQQFFFFVSMQLNVFNWFLK